MFSGEWAIARYIMILMQELERTQPPGTARFGQAEAYQALAGEMAAADIQPLIQPRERYGHEWRYVTAALRQDMNDPAVRRELIGYNSRPPSETLPAEAMHTLARIDRHVAQLETIYDEALVPYLDQPPIPDEIIGRDLRSAALPSRTIRMVAERYAFARDLKLLGLIAELKETGGPDFDAQGDCVLPSGTRLHVDPKQPITTRPLLNPDNWEGREKIKDRVHKLTIDGQPWIMKERKSSRHTDLPDRGYRPGLTSAEEFAIGREMQETGEVKEGWVHLVWEDPLAYVEYPDGPGGAPSTQFIITKYEPGMLVYESAPEFGTERRRVAGAVEAAILARRVTFEGEYQSARAEDPQLRFEAFAHRLTNRLIAQAEHLYDQTLQDHGLRRTDANRGMGFKLPGPRDEGFELMVIGFDLEYVERTTVAATPASLTERTIAAEQAKLSA